VTFKIGKVKRWTKIKLGVYEQGMADGNMI
jgi:hypothetical protein